MGAQYLWNLSGFPTAGLANDNGGGVIFDQIENGSPVFEDWKLLPLLFHVCISKTDNSLLVV